jgi:ankyrin repeat protein
MLIEAGADINKLTNNGWTPLRFAATSGHPEITKILIDAGADLNISNPLRNAVQAAKYNGHDPNSKKYCRACQACADLLIQAGATIPDYSASTSNDSDSDDTSSEGSGLGGSDDNAWF